MTGSIVIEETRDTGVLASFHCSNPALYAYQLGDLDPLFFSATRWWIARRNEVTASLLLYSACETAVVQAITDNKDRGEIWNSILPGLPDRAHAHYLRRHEPIIRRRYRIGHLGMHQRMQWNRRTVLPRSEHAMVHHVRVLNNADRHQIRELYYEAYPSAYFDERTLAIGRTTGAFAGEQLVAIAACHVYSRQ